MQITRKFAYASQVTLFLCLLLLTSACQNTPPTANVNNKVCAYNQPIIQCTFKVSYPSDATGTFKFLIVVGDPQHTTVVPNTSGILSPGVTLDVTATFQHCPVSILIEDAGQQSHPTIDTFTEPC